MKPTDEIQPTTSEIAQAKRGVTVFPRRYRLLLNGAVYDRLAEIAAEIHLLLKRRYRDDDSQIAPLRASVHQLINAHCHYNAIEALHYGLIERPISRRTQQVERARQIVEKHQHDPISKIVEVLQNDLQCPPTTARRYVVEFRRRG